MSADQLIKEIEEKESILPKDFLDNSSEAKLIAEIEEIFKDHKAQLDAQPVFKEKYIELVSYVYYWALSSDKFKGKQIFDQSLIDYLTKNQIS